MRCLQVVKAPFGTVSSIFEVFQEYHGSSKYCGIKYFEVFGCNEYCGFEN
jgi:hypothetical protein